MSFVAALLSPLEDQEDQDEEQEEGAGVEREAAAVPPAKYRSLLEIKLATLESLKALVEKYGRGEKDDLFGMFLCRSTYSYVQHSILAHA